MRIAYLREIFPKNSETFLMEEVAALIAAGHEVRVIAARPEPSALHHKVFERRLLDHVQHPDASRLAHVLRFGARLALRRSYSRGYLSRLYPGRGLADLARQALRERGPAGLGAGLAHSMDLHNLSLGLAHRRPSADFVPDVIHVPFLFRWETRQLERLHRALPSVPFTVVLRADDLHREHGHEPGYGTKVQLLAEAASVITISRFNRDLIARGLRPHTRAASRGGAASAIPIVHSAIDTSFFAPRGDVARRSRQVISVGRLVPKKGLHVLIEACALLRDRDVELHCHIIGDGPLRESLLHTIASRGLHDRITVRGTLRQHEVREALAASELFVLPCVVEDDGNRDVLPNALKEAMAMELPVVTSDISGIEELVTDGVDGLLVPPGDAVALADRIARLLGDGALRERLGRAARAVILRDFDCASETNKLIEVLQGVVARTPTSR